MRQMMMHSVDFGLCVTIFYYPLRDGAFSLGNCASIAEANDMGLLDAPFLLLRKTNKLPWNDFAYGEIKRDKKKQRVSAVHSNTHCPVGKKRDPVTSDICSKLWPRVSGRKQNTNMPIPMEIPPKMISVFHPICSTIKGVN
jgi:hypothetical protein